MLKKILKWTGVIIVVAFVAVVIGRAVYFVKQDKTKAVVEKIHNTKLALADVLGDNLPPVPENPDATVVGVDTNKNGIRDDVELAIFAEYPNSARTRAVLLQYALALQMEVTQELVNTGTVIAVAQDRSRASKCIGDAVPRNTLEEFIKVTNIYTEFVTKRQINTPARDNAQKKFYKHLDSYSDLDDICDIDLSTLPN
ncbi:MAG: hypothetical protein A3C08_00545 [Candidatus Taylorbacteria bacterium RIFCSPHIGHO2_02_FULL_47_18]|nr:MAG: hypothetical protein A3C08_00545 [Candidatus Taylorbacteria bacterium RIFCSPHIGHO2_02_FULL_47_18]OHA40672.1 MAG: hypothetical protein A3J31_02110 [Candidatus Taylorbacteria bacterium RIFCSPLOWO2_02_FULL_48_16]